MQFDRLTESRRVGDPEMMAAGMAGLIEDYWFDMKERGRKVRKFSLN